MTRDAARLALALEYRTSDDVAPDIDRMLAEIARLRSARSTWSRDTTATLLLLRSCASAWEPDARLLGNLRADWIIAACNEVLGEHDERAARLLRQREDEGLPDCKNPGHWQRGGLAWPKQCAVCEADLAAARAEVEEARRDDVPAPEAQTEREGA